VSHTRDHGYRAIRDRAHHRLGVEAPEIFQRAAAAHEQHEVHIIRTHHVAQCSDDLELGAVALHARRRDQQRRRRRPTTGELNHVANRGTGGRGHDADPPRVLGQRAFARLVEQAFGLEPAAQLLERQLQRALATRLDLANDQLQLAARLVDRGLSQQQQIEAVLQLERQPARVVAKQRTANLSVGVLECEVVMTGARDEQITGLARNPHAPHRVLDQRAQSPEQVAHPVDPPFGRTDGIGRTLLERQLRVIHYSVGDGASAATIGAGRSDRSSSK